MTSLADPKPFEDRFRRGEITQAELDRLVPYSKLASPAAKQGHNQRMSDMRNRMFDKMSTKYPRGNQGMFGNPYMQRPMFGGGFGGGFNPYQQRPMFGGGFGGGFNPYQQRPMFNPYQQQSMGFGFPQPQPRFTPFGGGFSRGFNPFRQNLAPSGLFNPQRLGMLGQNFRQQNPRFQNPMSDAARRQSLMAAMQAQQQAQQAQRVPVATGVRGEEMVNTAGSDPRLTAARAMNQARFMAPQGLGGTAQFQNPTVNAGAADAARAMATAQFSGNPTLQQTTPTTVPFSGPMMSTGAGGGIVPQFGLNPMNQQGVNTNPGAGGGIVPAFGLNPMNQQGAGGTNQPAAGGTV